MRNVANDVAEVARLQEIRTELWRVQLHSLLPELWRVQLHSWLLVVIGLVTLTPWTAQAAEGAGSVNGRVTLNGVPLAEGKLLLCRPGDKEKVETPIKAGLFAIEMVAAGKYDVAIQGGGVPAKYTSLDTSGLTVEIKAGKNEFAFALVGK
ncbi:MAG: hypothetical protein L0211_02760 [Planctomycetaceae bacterium]|nr:hypothetical protein [Planctomycetaceae bacterium]